MRSTTSHVPFDIAPGAAQRVAAQSVAARLRRDDGTFRLSLGLALLAHALFFVSFISAPTRQLGDPGGVEGAVSIELATEADLKAMATVAESGGQPMKPTLDPAEVSPPMETPPLFPQPAPPQPQSEQPPAESRAAEVAKLPDTQKPPEPKSPEAKQPEPKQQQATPKLELKPQDFDLPGFMPPEVKKPTEQKKAAPSAQKQAMLPQESKPPPPQPKPNPIAPPKLDLNLPQSAFERPTFTGSSGNGSAGMERPAGITRSGENDDFARGVIRALQRTMPQLSNIKGNVTVRITLDDRGNLVATVVTRRSNIDGLDQNVVFATKQSSFPIPPKNHVQADLVFLVTYIYR